MHLLIADNIPFAEEAFSLHGRVERFAGRQPAPHQLQRADVLLVRSITQVDDDLLAQAPQLKFVGTATIGMEHLDRQALQARGIAYANSPGANADSVAEYVLTALLALSEKQQRMLAGQRAAVVGAGNTGQATGRRLTGLGMQVGYYDPPRQRQGCQAFSYIDWHEVLSADVISLHVPLTNAGKDKTLYLLGAQDLRHLGPSQVLVNASRGPVVDNYALRAAHKKQGFAMILDVWEGEPKVDHDLLAQAEIATPHIAGHSLNGKVRGTQMLYDACARHFNWPATGPDWAQLWPAPEPLNWQCAQTPSQTQLADWVLQNYPIWEDDRRMRAQGKTAAGFDQLRKAYPVRYELCSQLLTCAPQVDESVKARLQLLGFTI